ncbi:MAG: phosphoglycerate kinase, partial [Desulfobulbales bacterium]
MKTIRELDLQGKRVLIRVDYNVPMDGAGNITDDIRIRMALPTLRYAIENKARVILCSHMGRPKGKRVAEYSLAPVASALTTILEKPVTFAPDCIGTEADSKVRQMEDGDIVLLENLLRNEDGRAVT